MNPDFFHDLTKLLQFSDVAYSIQLIQSYGQYAKPAIFSIIVRSSAEKFIERHGVLNRLNEFSGKDVFRIVLQR